jgi:hypothetical protein
VIVDSNKLAEIFNEQTLQKLFPHDRADQFFDALLGDASEGAYDIKLAFVGADKSFLQFALNLVQRPGCCLACNLTYGLPDVFARHPIINIAGLVREIDTLLGDLANCGEWQLKRTNSVSSSLHAIPLVINLR